MTQKTALDFDTLRAANRERARTAEKFAECRSWTAADWMLALTGELGEAANGKTFAEDWRRRQQGRLVDAGILRMNRLNALHFPP